MKAPFFKRLAAYVIDMIIVSTIVTVICAALPNNDKELEKKYDELSEKFSAKEVNVQEYLEEYQDLVYENNKSSILNLGINLALTIAYFIVFQYMNKGQTLGKKILKIKVVENETKNDVSILKGLLRSIPILGLISNVVTVALIKVVSKSTYMDTYLTINEIELLFMVVTAVFVLYRKDGRGLHDMMANTMVITEEREQ